MPPPKELSYALADDGLRDLTEHPDAQQDRATHDADYLVYFKPYLTCSGKAYNFDADYDEAYAWIDIDEELGGFGFLYLTAHEVGHLLNGTHGSSHNIPTNAPDDPLATILDPGHFHGDRIDYFSNPTITYSNPARGVYNAPTGTSTKNNATFIATSFCKAVDLEQAGTTSVVVSGFDKGSHYNMASTVTLGSNGGPDGGPFAYYWEYANSPDGPWTYATNTNGGWNFYPPSNGTWYVRLTISNSDGFSEMDTWVDPVVEGDHVIQESTIPVGQPAHAAYAYDALIVTSGGTIDLELRPGGDDTPETRVDHHWTLIDAIGRRLATTPTLKFGQRASLTPTEKPEQAYFLVAEDESGAPLYSETITVQ